MLAASTGRLRCCDRGAQTGPALAAMVRPEVKPALMVTLEDAFAANPFSQVSLLTHPSSCCTVLCRLP